MLILSQLRFDPHAFTLSEKIIHDFPTSEIKETYKTCSNHKIQDLISQINPIKKKHHIKTITHYKKDSKRSRSK